MQAYETFGTKITQMAAATVRSLNILVRMESPPGSAWLRTGSKGAPPRRRQTKGTACVMCGRDAILGRSAAGRFPGVKGWMDRSPEGEGVTRRAARRPGKTRPEASRRGGHFIPSEVALVPPLQRAFRTHCGAARRWIRVKYWTRAFIMAYSSSGRRRLLLGSSLALSFVHTARAQQTLEWVGGAPGGGWHNIASELSQLIARDNPDLRFRVLSGGGLVNATRVNRNWSPLGWGADAFVAAAYRGEDPFTEKHGDLRSLGTGFSVTEHHFLSDPAHPHDDVVAALLQSGLRIGCAHAHTADEKSLRRILSHIGSSPEKIRMQGGVYFTGTYNELAAAYMDGYIDYVYAALARPAAMFLELARSARGGRLLGFPNDICEYMASTFKYKTGTIPARTYPTLQSSDLRVITMDTVLLANKNLPDEWAARIVKSIIGRQVEVRSVHPSMALWNPSIAVLDHGLPLHPGAARAYAEAGVVRP